MSDDKIYEVPAEWKQRGFINDAKYQEMYAALGRRTRTASGASRPSASTGSSRSARSRTRPTTGNVSIKWFEDGTLNAAYNCIDRHLPKRANQTAIIWEGDDPKD